MSRVTSKATDGHDLTRVGPGTVMGETMRQYWIPAAASSELKVDGDPMRLMLLGEQLIAFRDSSGRVGVLHGARSSILADEDGQVADAHSISAGLDYPGVGPEHAFLRDTGRAEYRTATDEDAIAAFADLARTEGIIPALEPAHALARARDLDAELILVGLSGRGDKDLAEVLDRLDPANS